MLDNAIQACPDSVYTVRDGAHFGLAFHVLFFLDLYLSSEGECQFNPPPPFGLSELEVEVVVPEPYRQDKLLGYLEHCRKKLDAVMAGMTEAWVADPCPFPYRDERP